jgi:hypothetical protein
VSSTSAWTSGGRDRLPVCETRIRSVLRFTTL